MVERIILAVMLTLTLWLFTANRLSPSLEVSHPSSTTWQTIDSI